MVAITLKLTPCVAVTQFDRIEPGKSHHSIAKEYSNVTQVSEGLTMEKDLDVENAEADASPVAQKQARGIFINSTVLGGSTAKILRGEFDKDGDNHISAEELASLTAAALHSRKESKFLKRVVLGAFVGIVLLLCSTFASSWAALALSRKVDTNDKTGDLVNDKTGATVSTRPRNDVIQLNINPEISRRRKMMHSSSDAPPSTPEETQDIRFLQETPEFTVKAQVAHDMWTKNIEGTLGDLEVIVSDGQGSERVAYVAHNSVTRTLVPPNNSTVRYSPLSLVDDASIRYYLTCPAGSVGDCKGFRVGGVTDVVRGLQANCNHQPDIISCLLYDDCLWDEAKGSCQDVNAPSCFSSESTAELRDGNLVKMRDLKIGEVVRVGDNKYQPIYSFAHKHDGGHRHHDDEATKFTQIFTTASSQPLELTSDHMVYRHSEDTPVPASNIKVGDLLMGSKFKTAEQVVDIRLVNRHGLYAPLTRDGTIVVNGVQASNYVSFQDTKGHMEIGGFKVISWHLMGHMWVYPRHTFCAFVSPSICKNEAYDEQGYFWWVKLGIRMTHLLQMPTWVQLIIPLVVVPLTAVVFCGCFIIERWGLIVLFALFVAVKAFKKPSGGVLGETGKIKRA